MFATAALGVTCGGESPTEPEPEVATRSRVTVAITLPAAPSPEGPVIVPQSISMEIRDGASLLRTVAESWDGAPRSMTVVVERTVGTSLQVRVQGTDQIGVLYEGTATVATQDTLATAAAALALEWIGVDALATSIDIDRERFALLVDDSVRLYVRGIGPSTAGTMQRLRWTSRAADVVQVGAANGWMVGLQRDSAWVVATSMTGAKDSVFASVTAIGSLRAREMVAYNDSTSIGALQLNEWQFVVRRPFADADSVVVHVRSATGRVAVRSPRLVIRAGELNSGAIRFAGAEPGQDTLMLSDSVGRFLDGRLIITVNRLAIELNLNFSPVIRYAGHTPLSMVLRAVEEGTDIERSLAEPLPVRIVSSNTGVAAAGDLINRVGELWRLVANAVGTAHLIAEDSARRASIRPDTSPLIEVISSGARFSRRGYALPPNAQIGTAVEQYGSDSIAVDLELSEPSLASVPDSVIMTGRGDFTIRSNTATGSGWLRAVVGGVPVDSASVEVTQGRLHTNLHTGTTGTTVRIPVYLRNRLDEAARTSTPITITIASTNPAVLAPQQSSVAIASGSVSSEPIDVLFGQRGDVELVFTDSSGRYGQRRFPVTVRYPRLAYYLPIAKLGVRQRDSLSVILPTAVSAPVTVAIESSDPSVARTSASSVTIPAGATFAKVLIDGQGAVGSTTIRLSADNYEPTERVLATAPGRLRLSTAAMLSTGDTLRLHVQSLYPSGGSGAFSDHTPLAVTANQSIRLSVSPLSANPLMTILDAATRQPINSVTIPAGAARSAEFLLVGHRAGEVHVVMDGGSAFEVYSALFGINP